MYGTVADKKDNLVRKDGGPFSEKDFFQNPGEYKSVFYEKVYVHVCVKSTQQSTSKINPN